MVFVYISMGVVFLLLFKMYIDSKSKPSELQSPLINSINEDKKSEKVIIPNLKTVDISFVSIDFETANRRRGSACAIGMCKVENGIITDRYVKLLRPKPFEFEPQNIYIHGIDESKTRNAPTILEDWDKIRAFIGDFPLVAHNASFDKSVLDRSLEACGASPSGYEIACTKIQSERIFPNRENHKLSDLCNEYGIPLNHHDAGSDAEACAQLRIIFQGLQPIKIQAKSQTYTKSYTTPIYTPIIPKTDNSSSPLIMHLSGLSLVFTGQISNFSTELLESIVKRRGAKIQKMVSKNTDYLVKGNIHSSSATDKAKELNIPILNEREFFDYMNQGKKPLWLTLVNGIVDDEEISKRLRSTRAAVSRLKRNISELQESILEGASEQQYEKYEKMLYDLKQWEETKSQLEAIKGNVQRRVRKY